MKRFRGKNQAGQKGMALVIALIMLLVLTFVGLNSVGSSIFETKISGHDRFGSNAFYAAEGGTDVGISRIPDISAFSGNIGSYETYRSGRLNDSTPQPLKNFGMMFRPGFDPTWEFKRFQVNVTGESSSARREVEVQLALGPYASGTSYNN